MKSFDNGIKSHIEVEIAVTKEKSWKSTFKIFGSHELCNVKFEPYYEIHPKV